MLLFVLRRLAYKTLFGGVEGFWSDHYRLINGFPNRFWGWGGEDDDLYVRYVARKAFLQAVCQVCSKNIACFQPVTVGFYTIGQWKQAIKNTNSAPSTENKINGDKQKQMGTRRTMKTRNVVLMKNSLK